MQSPYLLFFYQMQYVAVNYTQYRITCRPYMFVSAIIAKKLLIIGIGYQETSATVLLFKLDIFGDTGLGIKKAFCWRACKRYAATVYILLSLCTFKTNQTLYYGIRKHRGADCSADAIGRAGTCCDFHPPVFVDIVNRASDVTRNLTLGGLKPTHTNPFPLLPSLFPFLSPPSPPIL